jgi:hypothetical protein
MVLNIQTTPFKGQLHNKIKIMPNIIYEETWVNKLRPCLEIDL